MADQNRCVTIAELPSHLVLEILSSGRLGANDLPCLETSMQMFRVGYGVFPSRFALLIELAAYHACEVNMVFASMSKNVRKELQGRCCGNWKKVLRFLQFVEQSSSIVETSAGKMITCTSHHLGQLETTSLFYSGRVAYIRPPFTSLRREPLLSHWGYVGVDCCAY